MCFIFEHLHLLSRVVYRKHNNEILRSNALCELVVGDQFVYSIFERKRSFIPLIQKFHEK